MKQETGRIKGDLGERTKRFALDVIRLYGELPKKREAQVLGNQVLRSGTSVGAHCREAQRAKSVADFISKVEGALQELDETTYWLELLRDSKLISTERVASLLSDCDELISIMVTIVKKSRDGSRR